MKNSNSADNERAEEFSPGDHLVATWLAAGNTHQYEWYLSVVERTDDSSLIVLYFQKSIKGQHLMEFPRERIVSYSMPESIVVLSPERGTSYGK